MKSAIAETQPDLIVFSGDQLNGQDTSWSTQDVLSKWSSVVADAKIPWTAIFGNHDEETGESNKKASEYLVLWRLFRTESESLTFLPGR